MAQECMFKETYSIDLYYLPGTIPLSMKTPPANGYSQIGNPSYVFNLVSNEVVYSECNPGNDGQALLGKTNWSNADFGRYVSVDSSHNAVLFTTTYAGLYYTILIQNSSGTVTGYLPTSSSEVTLADPGDANETNAMDQISWSFQVKLYIGPDFIKPATGGSNFSGSIMSPGSFRISGATGDKDNRNLTIDSITLNGTIT
jgi:hypothetical protein